MFESYKVAHMGVLSTAFSWLGGACPAEPVCGVRENSYGVFCTGRTAAVWRAGELRYHIVVM